MTAGPDIVPASHGMPLPPFMMRHASAREDGSGAAPRASKGARILIVEDDFLVATQMEMALAEAGFEIVGVAATAEEAIALARQHRPVLGVMDIHLASKRDGVEAALELFEHQKVRCIFATAHHDEDTRKRAGPAAPLGWLAKPYTMAWLIAMVDRAVHDPDDKAECRGQRICCPLARDRTPAPDPARIAYHPRLSSITHAKARR